MISGLGRSVGEGIGYPLQYSWASLVAQLVKNPPVMQETWVPPLGLEDLEKAKATHPSILAWRIPRGVAKSRTQIRKLSKQKKHFNNIFKESQHTAAQWDELTRRGL